MTEDAPGTQPDARTQPEPRVAAGDAGTALAGLPARVADWFVHGILGRVLQHLAYVVPGGSSLRPAIHRLRGAHIGRGVWISQFVYVDTLHPEAVHIGEGSTIGLRTSIFTHLYWGPRRERSEMEPVVIGKNVYIGPHCLILPGARIGDGAVIRGGCTITGTIPAGTFCGTPTAKPLGRASVPLTAETSYTAFVRGLKPLRGPSVVRAQTRTREEDEASSS